MVTVWSVIAILLWNSTTVFAERKSASAVIRNDYFAIVTVKPGDSLAGLAKTYLGDENRAWQIARYNDISTAVEGRRIVIPLRPANPGGLQSDGYQVVPVLLYRNIVTGTPKSYEISAKAFESQMAYLREMGYTAITLKQFRGFLNLRNPLPPKAVLITFDTARRWVYDIAYPILKQAGITAAVFIPTGEIDKPRRLKWDELAQMAAAGFDIGTSGVTARNVNSDMSRKDAGQYLKTIEDEIVDAKAAIARHLKRPCRYFAYPGGATNDYMIAMLKKHQYKAAFTLSPGSNPFFVDNFKVHRTIIGGNGNTEQFRQNLTTFTAADLK